ncbi:3-phosphoshikimate 1-carboxyvinyltransferase [Bacteroidia bacterium]|nr:3-phosphoshikimate 1-carboxyvinyltransferase [Bacteroidia bacterium]
MIILLSKLPASLDAQIDLPASKSIANRLLIMRALSHSQGTIHNLSDADDTVLLQQLLGDIEATHDFTHPHRIDCHNAGSVFRFLTAFLSIAPGQWLLTGDDRLLNRPIYDLVTTLRSIGADITYQNDGNPPLLIHGQTLRNLPVVHIHAEKSSQFVSALMLIAPAIDGGLTIELGGATVSAPYITMTATLLQQAGCTVIVDPHHISVKGRLSMNSVTVESDWTAASYFYALAALADTAQLYIPNLFDHSVQGDTILIKMFEAFGINTNKTPEGLVIQHNDRLQYPQTWTFDFTDCPDIAPTMACFCVAKNIRGCLHGLQTLQHKETDRIQALYQELTRLHADVRIADNNTTLMIEPIDHPLDFSEPIRTYSDHRMAMAFSLFSTVTDQLKIEDPQVVSKSYPRFWENFERLYQ